MIYDIDSLLNYIATIVILLVVFIFLYKRFVKSIYDPITYNIIVYLAFSSSLMVILYSENFSYWFEFLIFQIAFFIGITISHKYSYRKIKKNNNQIILLSRNSIQLLYLITVLSFLVVFLANLVILNTTGLAIFSDVPSVAKVENFSNGQLGILRRISWSLGNFVIPASLILILSNFRKKTAIIIFTFSMFFSVGSGGKSAILSYVFYIYTLCNHSTFKSSITAKKLNSYLPLLGIIAVAVAFSVLLIENEGADHAFYALINRLLYSGDVLFYYYASSVQSYFSDYNFFTYIYNNILNPLLGMLRLVPYELPTGYQMLNVYYNWNLPFDTILGSNTPFYIASDLYFGSIAGVFYSFFVAYFIGISKSFFLKKKANALFFALSAWLYINSFTFMIEATLFIGHLFEMTFFLTPILLIAVLIHQNSKKSELLKI